MFSTMLWSKVYAAGVHRSWPGFFFAPIAAVALLQALLVARLGPLRASQAAVRDDHPHAVTDDQSSTTTVQATQPISTTDRGRWASAVTRPNEAPAAAADTAAPLLVPAAAA
jgi:hypothetical protein